MKQPKLQWVKVHRSGVWVDRSAFYCIRRHVASPTPPFKRFAKPRYDAWETFPDLQCQRIAAVHSLAFAKRACQEHVDRLLLNEEAA